MAARASDKAHFYDKCFLPSNGGSLLKIKSSLLNTQKQNVMKRKLSVSAILWIVCIIACTIVYLATQGTFDLGLVRNPQYVAIGIAVVSVVGFIYTLVIRKNANDMADEMGTLLLIIPIFVFIVLACACYMPEAKHAVTA